MTAMHREANVMFLVHNLPNNLLLLRLRCSLLQLLQDSAEIDEEAVSTAEATVEGLVWTKGAGGTKNVVVKLFRRVNGKTKERVAKTKTAADGSYKFSIKGSEAFMGGEFYIKVQRPKGREFSKSKWRS